MDSFLIRHETQGLLVTCDMGVDMRHSVQLIRYVTLRKTSDGDQKSLLSNFLMSGLGRDFYIKKKV